METNPIIRTISTDVRFKKLKIYSGRTTAEVLSGRILTDTRSFLQTLPWRSSEDKKDVTEQTG